MRPQAGAAASSARRFLCAIALLAIAGFAIATPMAAAQEAGLPLPRFVSLDDAPARVRFGPGERYPVDWLFTRRDLPLQVVEENGQWRKVVDYEGASGWMHARLFSAKRTVMIYGAVADLRRTPSRNAPIVRRAEPGVIGDLLDCQATWCFLEVATQRGWVRREHLWGVGANEFGGDGAG